LPDKASTIAAWSEKELFPIDFPVIHRVSHTQGAGFPTQGTIEILWLDLKLNFVTHNKR